MADKANTGTPVRRLFEWLLKVKGRDQMRLRRGRLTAVVLLVSLMAILVVLLVIAQTSGISKTDLIRAGVMVALCLVVFVLNRRGFTPVAGVSLAGLLLAGNVLLLRNDPVTPNAVALAVPVLIAGLFGPPVSAIVLAVLAGGSYVALNVRHNPGYVADLLAGGASLQTALVYFNLLFVAVVSWLFARVTNRALEESQELSLALVSQREELEQRLETQTRQLHATTAVARAIAGTHDLEQLLENIVQLVHQTFGYYHVQVFLIDEENEYAILKQSMGEAGQELLMRGHQLPVGSLSVIGQVTASGKPVIARDTDTDVVHRRNELLPHTRSEMAIPLTVGDRVIGAIDLQSVSADAFDEDTIPTLQAMADQLGIAIENARLFQQAQQNLRELGELSRQQTQRSWGDFLAEAEPGERRQVQGPEGSALAMHRSRVVERVMTTGSTIVSTGRDGRQSFLAAPLVVRDEIIGVIGAEPVSARDWTLAEMQLIQSIAERTALAVENARLYIQARRAASREQLINTIAARLQRAPSLSMLLQTAAEELSEALGTENVYAEISMRPGGAQPHTTSAGEAEDGVSSTRPNLQSAAGEPEEVRGEA